MAAVGCHAQREYGCMFEQPELIGSGGVALIGEALHLAQRRLVGNAAQPAHDHRATGSPTLLPGQGLLGAIARTHQRTGNHFAEAAREAGFPVLRELLRRDEARHRQMVRCRPQVLAQRDDVHVRGAQVVEGLDDFRVALAEAEHEAALGQHIGAMLLGVRQHGQRLFIAGARVAHRMRQASHGLQVLREHRKTRINDGLHIAQHTWNPE